MNDAHVHTIPADTTVVEDTRELVTSLRTYYAKNRDIVLIASVIGLSLLVTRRMLRRELKRLNFVVEVFGEYENPEG